MRKNLRILSFLLFVSSSLTAFAQGDQTGGALFASSASPAFATFQSALKHRDLGEVTRARELFDKVIQQDPNFAAAHVYRATFSSSPQEYVSHLAKAKEVLGGAGEWEKLLYEFYETSLKNDMEKRMEVAKKMVASFPDKPRAYLHLGDVHSDLDEIAKEREAYQKAIALEPAWPGAYVALANSYLFGDPKDYRQAEAHAAKAVALAPSSATYVLQGDVFRGQNNLAKAEEFYSKAIALDAGLQAPLYKRGHVNSFLGRFDKARTDYEAAGKLDNVPTLSRQFIAFTYLYEGKPDKAIQSLLKDAQTATAGKEAAMATTVKNVLLNTAADIAAHHQDAQKLQEIVTLLKPVSEEMGRQVGTEEGRLNQKAGMLFWEALLKIVSKDVAGAKQAAEEMKQALSGIKNRRRMDDYSFVLGMLALDQKDYQTATAHLEKLSKQDIYGQYLLAKAYEGMGHGEKATTIFKTIADYNFNGIGYALIRNEVRKKVN